MFTEMLKAGRLNSSKFLLQSMFPEDWKLLNRPGAGIPELPQLVDGWKSLLKVSGFIGPFLTLFSHTFFFAHCQGKDPGLEERLVSVSLEVLALYRCCTAAHHFYVMAQASKKPVTVLPAGLTENLLLLCSTQEIPCFLWNCGVFCTADSH